MYMFLVDYRKQFKFCVFKKKTHPPFNPPRTTAMGLVFVYQPPPPPPQECPIRTWFSNPINPCRENQLEFQNETIECSTPVISSPFVGTFQINESKLYLEKKFAIIATISYCSYNFCYTQQLYNHLVKLAIINTISYYKYSYFSY